MPPTDEQRRFIEHTSGAFVTACPGSGKTRTIAARVARLAAALPPRKGIAVLSFTNSAIDEFVARCHAMEIAQSLRHPGFVGTFDAFLRHFFFSPGGIDGLASPPVVLDSWSSLGVEIRLRAPNAFRGAGVPLDQFDAATNAIDLASIGFAALREHVEHHRAEYQAAARSRREALHRSGYLSAADVRVHVLNRLERHAWSQALGQALSARFHEIVIDEAQDCNPLDCRIIRWLRASGLRISVVADPDQAIYGFRHGTPAELRAPGEEYDVTDDLTMTGNFRSSPAVCRIAATMRLRAVPDVSVGETVNVDEPVHLMVYPGNRVPAAVGRHFNAILNAAGISPARAVVLAHARQSALRACGRGAKEDGGTSKVAALARAVSSFWSATTSGSERERALWVVERALLELMGMKETNHLPRHTAERNAIDYRWLRRCALDLVAKLPRHCADTEDARREWIDTLRTAARGLGLTIADRTSINAYFRHVPDPAWRRVLDAEHQPQINTATVHEAKGKEFDAVCVVVPPDRAPLRRTQALLTSWRERGDDEAKRVLYVGVTRARSLAAIAIPDAFLAQIQTITAPIERVIAWHQL